MIKNVFYILVENQRIFLSTRKDLGVGGWGLKYPYGVRILNPLEIIGQSLISVQNQVQVTTSKSKSKSFPESFPVKSKTIMKKFKSSPSQVKRD